MLPSVVAVPSKLRLSLEKQLAEKGRVSRNKRKDPVDDAKGAALEARGALLRNAARWENEKNEESGSNSFSLCVELKPKCGLPHGTGRRTKVRLKQQQQQQQLPNSSNHQSCYCPSDLFSGEPARRKKALLALVSDALARGFSHTAPRAAHFRLFGESGEPLEGTEKAERAIAQLLLDGGRGGGSGGVGKKKGASPFRLLAGALDSILSREPLLPRLLDAQRCPECPTAAAAAKHLSALREVAAEKKVPPPPPPPSSAAAAPSAAAAASSLRSYLTATSARDLSVMILLWRSGEGGGAGGGGRGGGRGGEDEQEDEKMKGGKPSLQRDALSAGGAVEIVSYPSSLSSSPSRRILQYRISLCDLDAKPSSKAELHAAADERLPRSGVRRRGEK